MALKHFITHKIAKLEKEPAATVTYSDLEGEVGEDTLSGYYQRCASQLKGILLQRSGKRYGVFNPESPAFSALIRNWQKEAMPFSSWARKAIAHISASLDSTDLLVDGYIAVFHEELADADKLYIFHLRYKDSVTVDANLNLSETRYLDFSNTGFGVCINLTDWAQDEDAKYITFSFGRGDRPLQNAILEAIGFTDTLNTTAETEEFLEIVDSYSRTLPEEQAFEYKSKVVDYCIEQDLRGEPVVFEELENHLANETNAKPAEAFSHYVIEKKKERRKQPAPAGATPEELVAAGAPVAEVADAVKAELIPDRKKLKGFIRFSGKNKDLSLSFSAALLGKDIEFNPANKSLLIHKVPESLLKQLSAKSTDNED
ncbi:MAG: nucleoid-associated protein [Pseudomonadota bacterium]|nr:nucleoid-associated protein [Pseudomonadota bacterium]MEE3208517.1 nucleoid-associated protein [Pseudomonadota bacterium]